MAKKSCGCKSSGPVYRTCRGNQGAPEKPCRDICVEPECGEPRLLTVIAPVVYDEVGINLCHGVQLPEGALDDYPTAEHILLEVINVDFNFGSGDTNSVIEQIPSRPYCVRITLRNIVVTLSAKLLDGCGKYLGTIEFATVYLNSDPSNPYFDEETNPTSAVIELYAPYGVSYAADDCAATPAIPDGAVNTAVLAALEPVIQFIGALTCNSQISQGLVAQGLAKAMNFEGDESFSVGLTLYFKSVYDVQYKLPHAGKAIPPKAEPDDPDDDSCLLFVEGDLLERNIKPLDLEPPYCEGDMKEDREDDNESGYPCD